VRDECSDRQSEPRTEQAGDEADTLEDSPQFILLPEILHLNF